MPDGGAADADKIRGKVRLPVLRDGGQGDHGSRQGDHSGDGFPHHGTLQQGLGGDVAAAGFSGRQQMGTADFCQLMR
jgi:hypothetical protein